MIEVNERHPFEMQKNQLLLLWEVGFSSDSITVIDPIVIPTPFWMTEGGDKSAPSTTHKHSHLCEILGEILAYSRVAVTVPLSSTPMRYRVPFGDFTMSPLPAASVSKSDWVMAKLPPG